MLSILTNFGCHFACSYCVYRDSGINIPNTHIDTFNWEALEEQLKIHRGELVSISGGGDTLYNYDKRENEKFYHKFFSLLKKYDCTLELHTSIINESFPYSLCERVVFHFTMPNQITMLNMLMDRLDIHNTIIRIVYVVQEHYTKHIVKEIIKAVRSSYDVDELSFRQMIDKNGDARYYLHDYLKEGHMKDWYYIEQADYNDYFVSGNIEKEYLKINKVGE